MPFHYKRQLRKLLECMGQREPTVEDIKAKDVSLSAPWDPSKENFSLFASSSCLVLQQQTPHHSAI